MACTTNEDYKNVVTYNMDTIHPRITKGWAEMKIIYSHRLNDAHISFEYVGDNNFNITIYFGACSKENRESFIRVSTTYPDTSLFAVKLTKSQAQGSHLDLQSAFGNLIKTKGLTEVFLLGHKDGVLCKVLLSQTQNSIKFEK